MDEVAPGLYRWTAPHPDWTPEEGGPNGWERDVACLAWEAEDALVLIDPLVPAGGEEEALLWTELDEIASRHDREIAVLISVFWHERSASVVFERYSKTLGARVFAHEKAVERMDCLVTDPFRDGERLPGGAEAFEAERADEVVFWLPGVAGLAIGDILLGGDAGLRLCPSSWVGGDEQLERARSSLRRLLELPIEMALTSHGPPVLSDGQRALTAALA